MAIKVVRSLQIAFEVEAPPADQDTGWTVKVLEDGDNVGRYPSLEEAMEAIREGNLDYLFDCDCDYHETLTIFED